LEISSSRSSCETFSTFRVSFNGVPLAIFSMIGFMSVFSIFLAVRDSSIFSKVDSGKILEISVLDFFSFVEISLRQSVIIFASRIESLVILERVLNSSRASGDDRTSEIRLSGRPFFFKSAEISVLNFGRCFFILLIRSREIFNNGRSVSGYILAWPGIGRRNSVFPEGRAFRTSPFVFLFFMFSICLSISLFIVETRSFVSWKPLISTRSCPLMLTFTSCRIVPIPLFTLQERRISPIFNAASLICSGVFKVGEVVISIKGIPRRSKRKVGFLSSFFIILAESSSSAMDSMGINPEEVSIFPEWAIRAVR